MHRKVVEVNALAKALCGSKDEAFFSANGSLREMQLRESEASGRISGLEKKIQYAEIEKVYSVAL